MGDGCPGRHCHGNEYRLGDFLIGNTHLFGAADMPVNAVRAVGNVGAGDGDKPLILLGDSAFLKDFAVKGGKTMR